MMKTVKQIADEMGIDKQKVYRFTKKHCISEAHQNNGVMYYDEAVETLIKCHFIKNTVSSEAHHEAHHEAVNEAVETPINTGFSENTTSSEAHHEAVNEALVKMLQRELEIKNKQIEELTATIRIQAESINADRKNELAETLIDGQQKFVGVVPSTADQHEPNQRAEEIKSKKSFWMFWKK